MRKARRATWLLPLLAVVLGGCAEPQVGPGALQPFSTGDATPHHFALKVRHGGSDPDTAIAVDSIVYAFTLRGPDDSPAMRDSGVVRVGQTQEFASVLPSAGRYHLHVDAYAHFAYGQAASERTTYDATIDTTRCEPSASVPRFVLDLRVMYVEATPTVQVSGLLDC